MSREDEDRQSSDPEASDLAASLGGPEGGVDRPDAPSNAVWRGGRLDVVEPADLVKDPMVGPSPASDPPSQAPPSGGPPGS